MIQDHEPKVPLWWKVWVALGLAFWAVVIYVAYHFITKWW
jgi:hypothetical protein